MSKHVVTYVGFDDKGHKTYVPIPIDIPTPSARPDFRRARG